MKPSIYLLAALGAVIGIESAAHAQVCTQPSPGVAQIQTTTATTALKQSGGTTKANTVDCGFLATSINVIGRAGSDALTLQSIPATVPVTIDLAGGVNNLTILLTAGNDTLTCGASSCNRDGAGGADATWTGTLAKLTIRGRAGNDSITVTNYAGVTALFGEDGDDVISGGSANDTISGGNGNDTLNGGGGDDTFTTLATFDGFDTIHGNGGVDNATYAARQGNVFLGPEGSEDVFGNSTEEITGGAGNDTLDFASSAVARTIRGGDGADFIRGSGSGDLLYGGDGDDTMYGGGGPDTIYGQNGFDDLTGGGGNDKLLGGNDDDSIFSKDTISAEIVNCGAGNDTYVTTNDTFTQCETATAVVPFANGSFESGDYTGWAIFDEIPMEADIWGIGTDGDRINRFDMVFDYESGMTWEYDCGDGPTPSATDGTRTAVELQYWASTHRIYQDVTVPANVHSLWVSLGYQMFGTVDNPDPMFDPTNQYIALNLRDPATDAILPSGEIFKTTEGAAPDELPVLNLYADMSAFAGQSVRVNVDIAAVNFCIPLQLDNFRFLVNAAGAAPERVEPSRVAGITPVLDGTRDVRPLTFAPKATAQASGGDADQELEELADLGEDDEAAAGGCSAGGGGASLVTGLLIGLALIGRRRRPRA